MIARIWSGESPLWRLLLPLSWLYGLVSAMIRLSYQLGWKKAWRAPVPVVVVTFLAVLELYKRAMVKIEQAELFGDIDIRYIEGSGELVLTGDDSLTSVEEG